MPIKRLHYFNGQFLREQDFTEEQAYHLEMRRRHNLRAHTSGIVYGLTVTPGAGKVTVQAGMAVDPQGREIVLDSAADLTITAATDVTISYNEEETDETSETGIAGKRRWTETAVLANAVNANGVVLAKVTALTSPVTLNTAFRPSYSAPAVEGDLAVKRDLTVDGNLTVKGTTTTVNTQEMQGNVKLGDADADTVTIEGRLVTGHSSNRLRIESPVTITGDVTTGGAVTLPGLPTAANHAATKQYIDTHTAAANPHSASLAKTGDTMSGALSIIAAGAALTVTSGNVGIGTPAPTQPLSVVKQGATTAVYENLKNDTHELLIGVDAVAIVSAMTASDLELRTNNADRIIIKANTGRVGINTDAPEELLHVKGNVAVNGNITMTGVIVQENWIAPALLNGWLNYGSEYNPAGYFRDKQGIVHLRGLVRKNTAIVYGQAIFTLPAGYQPPYRELLVVMSAPNVGARLDIDANGNVLSMTGSNEWISLDGISFRAGEAQLLQFVINPAFNATLVRIG